MRSKHTKAQNGREEVILIQKARNKEHEILFAFDFLKLEIR